MMVVMTVVVVCFRGVSVGVGTMRVTVMLDRVAARAARMRAVQRDDAGQDRAQERQKDDCLNH
jgi:hypothetical protein